MYMEKGMLRLYCLATRYCQTRSKHTLTLTRFISQQDVQKYADLTGDNNPIHLSGAESLVHGTYILGIVSGVLGTRLPGPGSVVSSLQAKFIKPCPVNTEISITVTCEKLRKLSTLNFHVTNLKSSEELVQGEAKILISKDKNV